MENASQQQKLLPNLFKIEFQLNELVLRSGETLNDARWGAWFGEIQEVLRNRKYQQQSFTSCLVDLSQCYWADPLPLLSLSLTLIEFEKSNGKVKVKFPPIHPIPDSKNPDTLLSDRQNHQARLLKFFVREGFFHLLACSRITGLNFANSKQSNNREVKFGNENYDANTHINLLREFPVDLAFERSTCLLATILDLTSIDSDGNYLELIDKWVEKVIFNEIDPVINEEVPRWAQDSLRYRLITFLRETLHNVFEHAGSKFAAIYVRYREGALGESAKTWERLSCFIERENSNNEVPLLTTRDKSESFPNTRTGFFEVFVLDSGQGLCKSLAKNKINPLHQTMLDVFRRGVSSKEKRPTQYGGLYLIGELLTPNKDFFRVRDEDAWWATQLPLKNEITQTERSGQITVDAYGTKHGNIGIKGLAWTVRLSWLVAQDLSAHNSPWLGFLEEKDRNKVMQVYRVDEKEQIPKEYSGLPVKDARFPFYP
ncbi:MAG: hypothetical protein ABL919_15450, partial [Methylococcales bacterium]